MRRSFLPLKYTFINRTNLIVHERGRYTCLLLFSGGSRAAVSSRAKTAQ
jgi:hypothetical protein